MKAITSRTAFIFSHKEAVKQKCIGMVRCCCRSRFPPSEEYALYLKGLKRIRRKFEITQVFKSMHTLNLIKHTVLAKYQRAVLPYFNENVLYPNNADEEDSSSSESDQELEYQKKFTGTARDKLQSYLIALTLQSKASKLDHRIVKKLQRKKPKLGSD